MPWHIEKIPERGFCVLKDSDGTIAGCHKSKSLAEAQLRALYASESKATGIEVDALKSYSAAESSFFVSVPADAQTVITEHGAVLLTSDPETHIEKTHEHGELHTFIATPRANPTIAERLRSMFKSTLHPGNTIVRAADGRRYMFIITSNSYEDRENETITSKALQAYEDSCYPGDGLYHNDNPLLWWHEDAYKMGDIVAVDYVEPFLIEVAREDKTAFARVLWDYAEQQGDKAGASHRFGYYDDQRSDDGVYEQIVKLETSYLPERDLAANAMTYAGVVKMGSKQADARLNEIFAAATGGKVTDIASAVRKNAKEAEALLASAGLSHKAAKAEQEDLEELESEVAEDTPVDEKEVVLPSDFMTKLQQLEAIYQMMQDMLAAEQGLSEEVVEMAKALKTINDNANAAAEKRKTFESTLEARVKALEDSARQKPRSVQRDAPETDVLKLLSGLSDAAKESDEGDAEDNSFFGKRSWKKSNPFAENGK